MKIIAVTGMPGSGKGEVVKYFSQKGIASITMSSVVENAMREKGIEINNKNLREFAVNLRKENGPDIVAKMGLPLVENLSKENDIVLIDGVRGMEEIKFFKNKLTDDFSLIGVFSPPKLRFERVKVRGKSSDMKTWEEFEWRDNIELGWGLGNVLAISDFMVKNIGTLEEFHKQLDLVLEKIR